MPHQLLAFPLIEGGAPLTLGTNVGLWGASLIHGSSNIGSYPDPLGVPALCCFECYCQGQGSN